MIERPWRKASIRTDNRLRASAVAVFAVTATAAAAAAAPSAAAVAVVEMNGSVTGVDLNSHMGW
jgi:hypothetical protein